MNPGQGFSEFFFIPFSKGLMAVLNLGSGNLVFTSFKVGVGGEGMICFGIFQFNSTADIAGTQFAQPCSWSCLPLQITETVFPWYVYYYW